MSPFTFCITMMIMLHFHFSFVNACRCDERRYLLDFRDGLNDSSGRLSSWQQFNCCQWEGVTCDYHSGHVVSLDLKPRNIKQCWETGLSCPLRWKIRPSLFNLQHLQYLDLSWNNFNGIVIPPQLAEFQRLTFLSLAGANFGGEIPLELSDIATLRYLDLSGNRFNRSAIPPQLTKLQKLTFLNLANAEFGGEIPVELGNITTLRYLDHSTSNLENRRFAGSIRNLRSLEYLAMNDVDLSMANERWGDALGSLSNLREIHLRGCKLSGTIPSLLNLTHLSHLDLSHNSFYSPLPAWFQNVSSLVSLDLSWSSLDGSIPSDFLHRSTLTNLDLSYNN